MNIAPLSRGQLLNRAGTLAFLLAGGVCSLDRVCAVDEADTIDIGSRRQLFLDGFIVEGREAGKGEVRGIWHVPQPDRKNLVYRDNIIKAVADEAKTSALGCVVISGSQDPEKDHAALFKNNLLISDFCNLSLGGGYYGAANNGRFVGNRFVKIGDKPSYRTIQCGSGGGTCVGFELIDSIFCDGASLDPIKWRGDGRRGFSVGYTLSIASKMGTEAVVKARAGDDVFSGRMPDSGAVQVLLGQYRCKPDGKIELTPHTVTVGGSTKTITADRTRAYRVMGETWKELPIEPPNTPTFSKEPEEHDRKAR